mgnify:CR=1 FL=1
MIVKFGKTDCNQIVIKVIDIKAKSMLSGISKYKIS